MSLIPLFTSIPLEWRAVKGKELGRVFPPSDATRVLVNRALWKNTTLVAW